MRFIYTILLSGMLVIYSVGCAASATSAPKEEVIINTSYEKQVSLKNDNTTNMMNLIRFFGIIGYSITLMYMLLDFEVKRIKGIYMLRNIKKGWGTFFLIPLSYNAYAFLMGKYGVWIPRGQELLWLDTSVTILIIAAYVLIFGLFRQTTEHLIMQNEQSILTFQVSALQERYEKIQESEEKTIIYHHDLRHHLYMINGYLADNNLTEIKRYVTEIERNIDDTVTIKYCDNNAVNLILLPYINRAKNEKIMVESQVYIPKNCQVSDMDLCIILGNAIENAINASMNIKDINDRKMNISCKSKNDNLFIQVTNNFIGEVKFAEDMPISTEEKHGFGTKCIAATVQKYSGLCSFTAEEGVFKVRVILCDNIS